MASSISKKLLKLAFCDSAPTQCEPRIPTFKTLTCRMLTRLRPYTANSKMTSGDLKNRPRSAKINRVCYPCICSMYVQYEILTLKTLACRALTRFWGHTLPKSRMTSGDLKNRSRSTKIYVHRKAPIGDMYVQYEPSNLNTQVRRATNGRTDVCL